jgi:hypothetical protein
METFSTIEKLLLHGGEGGVGNNGIQSTVFNVSAFV